MGDLLRLTSKNSTATAVPRRQALFGLSYYILSATMANVDEHFWLSYNLLINNFYVWK